ncbi:MAG: YqeG family HAD IIIA-type phosphatase [Candidatus Marinamargulisbacteria bacterium]
MTKSTGFNSILYDYLRPRLIYESIFDIDFQLLKADGIKSLFFDVDNTIIKYGETAVSLQSLNLFNAIATHDFDNIILISNNSSVDRIQHVSKQLNLPAVTFACKPFVFTMRRLIQDYNIDVSEAVLIGDQLFTDVLLANITGMSSIYVDPIDVSNISFLKQQQYKLQASILSSF